MEEDNKQQRQVLAMNAPTDRRSVCWLLFNFKRTEQPYTRITWPYVASPLVSARTTITSDFHTHVHSMKTGPSPIREPHTPRTENSHEKNSSSQFNKVLDWRNAGTSSLAPTAAS